MKKCFMKLDEVAPNTRIFVDANIFIYHFTGVSDQCSAFLTRCERGELVGATSLHVVFEVLHRLMMIEAIKKGLVKSPKIVEKLKKHPKLIRRLTDYYQHTAKIEDMGIHVFPLAPEILRSSQQMRARYGLLVNDSLILALMNEGGIRALATHDKDFEQIEPIAAFRPDDVRL